MRGKLTAICIFISTCLFSQLNFQKGDSLYVWANSGLNLRESPNEKGNILLTIPFGEIIEIDSLYEWEIKVELIKSIENNGKWSPSYSVKGNFVKVNYQNTTGYIYSGFLSKLKPIYNLYNLYQLREIFDNKYGVFNKFEWGTIDNENSETLYNNGFIYCNRSGVGWFESTYFLPNVTFQEGLLLINLFIYNRKKENEIWFLEDVRDSFLTFSMNSEMYHASICEVNNICIITINGAN